MERFSGVKVVQYGRDDYDLDFLKLMVQRVIDEIPGARGLNLLVQFRSRKGFRSKDDPERAGGWHNEVQPKGVHTIVVDKKLILQEQCEILAHEMGHAIQDDTKQIEMKRGGHNWEGEFWPSDTPYNQRPWEIDARRYERYGAEAYRKMEAKGLIPKRTIGERQLEEHFRKRPEDIPSIFGEKWRGIDPELFTKPVSEMTPKEIELVRERIWSK
jgi:hypothetical protein